MTGGKGWKCTEYSVPVTFGFINGKYWTYNCSTCNDKSVESNGSGENNNEDDINNGTEKYLALHGWQDNCGTWDELIPQLLSASDVHVRIEIFAIDLPGHGLSSHYPPGCSYSDLAFTTDVKRVIKHLDWHRFSILGHSMGGFIGIFYASLFPDSIDKVIAIDIVKPLTFKSEDLASMAASSINSFLAIEEKLVSSKTPVYGKDECVTRLLAGHSKIGKLTNEAAHVLLKRGCKKLHETNDKSYYFTRDPRLSAIFFSRLDTSTVKAYLSQMKCNLYILKANDGIKLDDDSVTNDFIDLYSKCCSTFQYIKVDGPHHVQLCAPSNILQHMNNILTSNVHHADTK